MHKVMYWWVDIASILHRHKPTLCTSSGKKNMKFLHSITWVSGWLRHTFPVLPITWQDCRFLHSFKIRETIWQVEGTATASLWHTWGQKGSPETGALGNGKKFFSWRKQLCRIQRKLQGTDEVKCSRGFLAICRTFNYFKDILFLLSWMPQTCHTTGQIYKTYLLQCPARCRRFHPPCQLGWFACTCKPIFPWIAGMLRLLEPPMVSQLAQLRRALRSLALLTPGEGRQEGSATVSAPACQKKWISEPQVGMCCGAAKMRPALRGQEQPFEASIDEMLCIMSQSFLPWITRKPKVCCRKMRSVTLLSRAQASKDSHCAFLTSETCCSWDIWRRNEAGHQTQIKYLKRPLESHLMTMQLLTWGYLQTSGKGFPVLNLCFQKQTMQALGKRWRYRFWTTLSLCRPVRYMK